MLKLFSVFHLNLAFSSIEVEQRPEVIKRCYWPLLRLADKLGIPMGIEATGYTLENIAAIDPLWLDELRRLTLEGNCEFIGSGYVQLIGPLVPHEVNGANLRQGNLVYENLLGKRPEIALVNEQAYSSGLVANYIDAGYRAIMMEWENPHRCHPEWSPEWRYLPQFACGPDGKSIPVIWNNAISFQKFQRYAHCENALNEFTDYLKTHLSSGPRTFSFYSNDVEIFDFRPGRYQTEEKILKNEWERIENLFSSLLSDDSFEMISPGRVLNFMGYEGAGNQLHLETAEQPVPVKKQAKYNISRWAVTGRDDVGINTICWRIYEALKRDLLAGDDEWRELCYLWSSDFRTHITEKRWNLFVERLIFFEKKTGRPVRDKTGVSNKLNAPCDTEYPEDVLVEKEYPYLLIETGKIKIRLNCRRGLSIDALWFKNISEDWICGTIPHGFFDDINWGADYYTGHLVQEAPGYGRFTDLDPIENLSVVYDSESESIVVKGILHLESGVLEKSIHIPHGGDRSEIDLKFCFTQAEVLPGTLRLGYITLNPDLFSRDSLHYAVHNGGRDLESFVMKKPVNHGRAVSFLVSAKQVLGCTGSLVKLGDKIKQVNVSIDKSVSNLFPMIHFQEIGSSYICRLYWSAREMDETSRKMKSLENKLVVSMSISCEKNDTC